MVTTCKSCGHPLPDDSVLGALTPLQVRVFLAIKRAGPGGVNSRDLLNIVYANDPTGGPDSSNIIAVVANHMRPRLTPFGLRLRSKVGRGGYYVLEKIEGETNATNR